MKKKTKESIGDAIALILFFIFVFLMFMILYTCPFGDTK